jgi:hypothetical protein
VQRGALCAHALLRLGRVLGDEVTVYGLEPELLLEAMGRFGSPR